jgi:hypothetical protein
LLGEPLVVDHLVIGERVEKGHQIGALFGRQRPVAMSRPCL